MRKSSYRAKPFESSGGYRSGKKMITDTSANIYESMLRSEAYQSLTPRQRQLYVVCKAQYYGKRKPKQDYKELELFQGDEYFYLNWATVKLYGLYTENMSSNFYKDMKALCEAGLIEQVSSGARKKERSVFRFSCDWKEYSNN